MKKILLIFGQLSVNNQKANPDTLCALFNEQAKGTAFYQYSLFEDLAFYVSDERTLIHDVKNGWDIADFDFVYFRKWGDMPEAAMASTMYLKNRQVAFIDHELDRPGAIDKLTQHWKLWENGLSIPSTVYMPAEHVDSLNEQQLLSFGIEAPFIVKSTDGTRGKDNYLAKDLAEAKKIIQSEPDKRFLIQNFIPNNGDYRAIVGGDRILLVIQRTAVKGSHKNNTSQGGKAKIVSADIFSKEVQQDIIDAAQAFRRELAGVDIVFDKNTNKHYFFEVNRSPQIEASSFSEKKASIINQFFLNEIENKAKNYGEVVGRVEKIDLPRYGIYELHARVDTGAKTSSIWASNIKHNSDGTLSFYLFSKGSPLYNGKKITVRSFSETVVSNSMGGKQKRYKVRLSIVIKGHKVRANFTLADRSQQVYPVLIGRNILSGKFVVDVTQGSPLREAELNRTKELRKLLGSNRKEQ